MRPLALVVVFAAVLFAGCGGGGSDATRTTPRKPVQPLGGNLLNAASLEPIGDVAASVAAGQSKELELEFGDVKAGSLILITDRPKQLKGKVGDVPLREGDLFGTPAFFLTLAHPGTVTLTLENEGSEDAAAQIQLFAASERKIELAVEPDAVQPGEPVTFTATVTEPTDADVVRVRVLRDRKIVAELEPERVGAGTWRTTYTAESGGFYAVTARVEGGPPREISGIRGFEVAHRGTVITRFGEDAKDSDGDGLIDWLLIRLHVTVTAGGQYDVVAALADEAGKSLVTCTAPYQHLGRGKHIVSLRCYGPSIAATGVNGPYRIRHVQLTRVKPDFRTETDIRDLGRTKAYRFSDFEPLRF